MYNGEALTNDGVTVGGDGFVAGEGAVYNVTGAITDAGKVANSFTYGRNSNTNFDNYTITKEEGTLEVTPGCRQGHRHHHGQQRHVAVQRLRAECDRVLLCYE